VKECPVRLAITGYYAKVKLHCNYFIRSCDFLRYLRDDMYLTCRLTQWMCENLWQELPERAGEPILGMEYVPGDLTMFIGSLHIFEGDLPKMRRLYG
jgi:thymidylate synthase